jgi:hypothetical protein
LAGVHEDEGERGFMRNRWIESRRRKERIDIVDKLNSLGYLAYSSYIGHHDNLLVRDQNLLRLCMISSSGLGWEVSLLDGYNQCSYAWPSYQIADLLIELPLIMQWAEHYAKKGK